MKKLIAICLCILTVLGLSGCQEKQNKYTFECYDTFDTIVTVTVYAANEETAKEYSDTVFDTMRRWHEKLNRFEEYPDLVNLATINRLAYAAPVSVDTEFEAFLKFCVKAENLTNKKVDITFGAVTEQWRKKIEEHAGTVSDDLPDPWTLEEASRTKGIEYLEIDTLNHTVRLTNPGTLLDVGAVGKGYAAQKASDALIEIGCTSFCINAGGNVIAAEKPADRHRESWVFGLQNPDLESEDTLIGTASFNNLCMVTSGDYQRYYTDSSGKKMHHIIDVETGYPADYFHSVTVITDNSAIADVFSTALFCMDYETGKKMAEENNLGVIWVEKDGTIQTNEEADRYFTVQKGE